MEELTELQKKYDKFKNRARTSTDPAQKEAFEKMASGVLAKIEQMNTASPKKKGKTKFKSETEKQEILNRLEMRRASKNAPYSVPAESVELAPKPKRIRTKAQTEKQKAKAEKPKREKTASTTKSAKTSATKSSKSKNTRSRGKIKTFGSPVENRILWDYYGMGNIVVPFDRVNRFMNRMIEAEKAGRIRKDIPISPLLTQVFTSVKNANNRAITTKKNTVNVVAPKNLLENIEELIYISEGGLKGLFGLMGIPYDGASLGNVEVGIDNVEGVVSATNLSTGEMTKIGISPYWQRVFGKPSAGFTAMVYGTPGTGKTTMLLKFAKHLANFGRVAYVSSEQAKYENGKVEIADTLKETIALVGANVPNLDFAAEIPKNLGNYDVLIIDSVQASGISPDQIKTLQNENDGLSIIAVSQVLKDGKYKGDTKLEHNSDIVIRLDQFGEAYNTKNRYASVAGLGRINFM